MAQRMARVNDYLTIGRIFGMANASTVTVNSILDAAQRITQTVGYNGLSFRDVASAVGIKSASVHYHFPTKGHLGAAIARRYTDGLAAHLAQIDAAHADPRAALAAYVSTIRTALGEGGKMCLGGMLAAETDAIPAEVQAEVRRFIDANTGWLAGTLARLTGRTAEDSDVRDHALALFAALEGAMMMARGAGDSSRFDAITAQFARTGLWPQ